MSNILEAISNIVTNPVFTLRNRYIGRNSINNIGESLEAFVKDAFADSFNIDDRQAKMIRHQEIFSWCGNQNNPPDMVLRNGDAIEVKKTQSSLADLALNSSYPKATLLAADPMITPGCKTCEDWIEKDLIYCVGHTTDDNVKSIWMVYGNIYAASHETYQIVKQKISAGINEIPNVEFSETKELGRVNRVDPLGISNLRIRGMWQIQNPRKVFEYLETPSGNTFELVALVPLEKYDSFSEVSRMRIMSLMSAQFSISDVKVSNPNNPAILVDCKLITFSWNQSPL
jgi:hypothetical protein